MYIQRKATTKNEEEEETRMKDNTQNIYIYIKMNERNTENEQKKNAHIQRAELKMAIGREGAAMRAIAFERTHFHFSTGPHCAIQFAQQ